MKITSRHISFEKLTELAEGRLSDEESTVSVSHLTTCSRCAARFNNLERLINLMRSDRAEDAPRDVRAGAVALFSARASSAKTGVVHRVLASLSFDSMQLTPAYGVRSGQSPTRQILYSAVDNDLELRVTPSGDAWIISGQVLGSECEGVQVRLQGETDEAAVPLNDLCEFTLPPVPSGSYTLRVRFKDMEVEVPDLELRA